MKTKKMVLKSIFVATCVICIGISTIAQKKQEYLIVAKNYNICQGSPYPIQLLAVKNNSLEVVCDFIKVDSTYDPDIRIEYDSTDRPRKTGIYHYFKIALVFTKNLHKQKYYFYVINFKDRLKIDTLQREFSENSITKTNFYIVNINDVPYVIFKQVPGFFLKDHTEVFQGINLRTYKDTVFITNEVTKYLHSEGEQGIALCHSTSDDSEIMKIKTIEKNNQIINPISYPSLENKDLYLFEMPEQEQLFQLDPYQKIPQQSPNEFFPLLIVNNQYIIYVNKQEYNNDNENGFQTYSIYSRKNKQWYETQQFKGCSWAGVRQFNNWLACRVSFEQHWGGYFQKIKKYGEIPGKKYRKQKCYFGETFDYRINLFKQFPIGTLYLYNMETRKYIEWEALENGEHQGDSEILLVEDEIVYYRINDKIYKAKIINGEQLGKAQLLVKDQRVPDIHWMFITK